jgi:hypothetical protein
LLELQQWQRDKWGKIFVSQIKEYPIQGDMQNCKQSKFPVAICIILD